MEQLELISQDVTSCVKLEDVFEAYYECRKNKRRTVNALKFEINLEENLIQLWQEINNGTYEIGKSVAFIVRRPVKREVFAADFRDRIVHHLVIRKLWPLLNQAISPHSYSCRPGMGVLYGIREVYQHIKKCSENYTGPCWVLKLDIRAFFMHIRHNKLNQMLSDFVKQNYHAMDKNILLWLIRKIVANKPQDYCIRKGSFKDWEKLPKAKSLFHVKRGKGLPIGNLSSQIFANFYLKAFDAFVAKQVGGFYGRYVDDMVLIHKSQSFLKIMLNKVRAYLWQNYGLILHPRKIYLQPVYNGFSFIGAFLKCKRIYAGKRLKKMFFYRIHQLEECGADKERTRVLSVMNSYLGFLKHYHTLRLRLKAWEKIQKIFPSFCLDPSAVKVFVKKTKTS